MLVPLFEVQGKYTLLVEADSFEQADLKVDRIQGQDLWVLTPDYKYSQADESHTFVATCLELERDSIQKRKNGNPRT